MHKTLKIFSIRLFVVAVRLFARLELVLWSAWGREWTAPDVSTVVARVVRDLAPGVIVLLHDNDVDSPPGAAEKALDALGPLADALERRGLRGVSLDELVASA